MDAIIFWTAGILIGLLAEYLVLGKSAPNPDGRRAKNITYGLFAALSAFISGVGTVLILQNLHWSGILDLSRYNSLPEQVIFGLILALLADFPYYCWHRAQHRFPMLWKIHRVHHADTGFDVTTYIRQHWLEEPCQALLITLPVALLIKLGTAGSVTYALCVNFIVFSSHFAAPYKMGPLTGIITGPELHKTHHSRNREWSDANYASITPIWDRIFGTYRKPN